MILDLKTGEWDDSKDSIISFRSDEDEMTPIEATQKRDNQIQVHLDAQGAPVFQINLSKVIHQDIKC